MNHPSTHNYAATSVLSALVAAALSTISYERTGLCQEARPPFHGDYRTPFVSSSDPTPTTYGGGPVLQDVQIVSVFWGANVNTTVTAQIGGFYSAFSAASQIGWLCEYNTPTEPISGGSFLGNFTIIPTVNTGTNITDPNIADELAAQINAGHLPSPNSNTLYVVQFPPGDVITDPNGLKSCVDFCGYHEAATRTVNGASTTLPYAVMPDFTSAACMAGCGDRSMFDNFSKSASHEIVEAITDTVPPSGWTPEIGDRCNFATLGDGAYYNFTSGGTIYAAQLEWSHSRSACVAGAPSFCLSTYASQTRGMTVSTFATGLPFTNILPGNQELGGPIGVAFIPSSQNAHVPGVWVTDVTKALYKLPDVDNGGPFNPSLTVGLTSQPAGLATAIDRNGEIHYYIALLGGNQVVEFNGSTGALLPNSASVQQPVGMIPFPPCIAPNTAHCGNLFVGSLGDPGKVSEVTLDSAGGLTTVTPFASVPNDIDALAWNPSGTVLYVVTHATDSPTGQGSVVLVDSTGAIQGDLGNIPGDPDGLALGTGNLQGCLYVNTNDGHMYELQPPGQCGNGGSATVIKLIANGGTRGDFVGLIFSISARDSVRCSSLRRTGFTVFRRALEGDSLVHPARAAPQARLFRLRRRGRQRSLP